MLCNVEVIVCFDGVPNDWVQAFQSILICLEISCYPVLTVQIEGAGLHLYSRKKLWVSHYRFPILDFLAVSAYFFSSSLEPVFKIWYIMCKQGAVDDCHWSQKVVWDFERLFHVENKIYCYRRIHDTGSERNYNFDECNGKG